MMWDDGSEMLWRIQMVLEGRGVYMRMAQTVMSKKLTRIDVESFFSLNMFL